MFPSAVFAEMTIPTKGLCSTSITSPCVQSLACVKSGDINTLSPVLIFTKNINVVLIRCKDTAFSRNLQMFRWKCCGVVQKENRRLSQIESRLSLFKNLVSAYSAMNAYSQVISLKKIRYLPAATLISLLLPSLVNLPVDLYS